MWVTCNIILKVLHTTHNSIHITHIIIHITHNVVHIIYYYVMRPCNHGLDIKTSQNESSTYGTSTRESDLDNTESASFIHTYFISFHLWASINTIYTYDIVLDFHRVRCAKIKNDLVSLLKSSSPLDYPIKTPLVSFISLSFILWGTSTLTDIDHVSIMKSSVMKPHTEKRWNHRPKWPKRC